MCSDHLNRLNSALGLSSRSYNYEVTLNAVLRARHLTLKGVPDRVIDYLGIILLPVASLFEVMIT